MTLLTRVEKAMIGVTLADAIVSTIGLAILANTSETSLFASSLLAINPLLFIGAALVIALLFTALYRLTRLVFIPVYVISSGLFGVLLWVAYPIMPALPQSMAPYWRLLWMGLAGILAIIGQLFFSKQINSLN